MAGPLADNLGTDPVKLAGDVKLSMMNGDGDGVASGKGPVPYCKALGGTPKRVALLSYYVYRANNSRSINVGTEEMGKLATELHDAGIEPLKQAFAAVGMQLLTPEEYLDTPEKKAAYENAQIEAGGMGSLFGALQSKAATQWQWGPADGYRLVKLTTVGDVRGNNFALATTGVGVGALGTRMAQHIKGKTD